MIMIIITNHMTTMGRSFLRSLEVLLHPMLRRFSRTSQDNRECELGLDRRETG